MRHAPTLTFIPDALPENARHLDEVLAQARAPDEAVAAAPRGGVRRRAPTRTRSRARTTLDEADADERATSTVTAELRAGRRRQARRA